VGGHIHRRTIAVLLGWALIVACVDLALLLRRDDDGPKAPPPTAARVDVPATSSPQQVAPPTVHAPSSTVDTTTRNASGTLGSPSDAGGSAKVSAAPPASDTTLPTAPRAPSVACHSELSLEDSPDAPYNFLCTEDGEPITWPTNRVTLYSAGLTGQQKSALQLALAEFQQASGLTVVRVGTPSADIVMTDGPLSNDEGGHASVHYTCSTSCAFDHADVILASDRSFTDGLWVTTMLHELGHVAGLDHVARSSEVMYPTLTLQSPLAYASGDRDGFAELARRRT
jgi:hypothetical protein